MFSQLFPKIYNYERFPSFSGPTARANNLNYQCHLSLLLKMKLLGNHVFL